MISCARDPSDQAASRRQAGDLQALTFCETAALISTSWRRGRSDYKSSPNLHNGWDKRSQELTLDCNRARRARTAFKPARDVRSGGLLITWLNVLEALFA